MVKQEAFTSIISCYVNGLIKRNWLHPFNIDTENLIKAGCKQIDLLRIKDVVSSSKEGLEIIYEVNKVPVVLFEVRKFTQGVDAARRAKAETVETFSGSLRGDLSKNNSQRCNHTSGSSLPENVGNSSRVTRVNGVGFCGVRTAVSGVAWLAVECVTAVEVGAEGVFATKAVTAAVS
nr:hypothetical protein Iba_scaffold1973CG0010 [Ipomoea batatas]